MDLSSNERLIEKLLEIKNDISELKTSMDDLKNIVSDLQSEISKQRLEWFRNRYTLKKYEVLFETPATYFEGVYKFYFSVLANIDKNKVYIPIELRYNVCNGDTEVFENHSPTPTKDRSAGKFVIDAIKHDIKRSYECLKNI